MRSSLQTRRFADARGFTLVELLVVLLLLGILLAIALPAWLDQRAKGEDAEAKVTIGTAATALHAHWTDAGTYDATLAQLVAIEPSLADAIDLGVVGDDDSYEISEESADSTVFTLIRHASGAIERGCTNHGYGLCRASPDANGNYW
jgi:type IV pilus assembly protein PilA